MATACSDTDTTQRTYEIDGEQVEFEIRGLDDDEREDVEEIAAREYRKAMLRSRNRNQPRDLNEWAVISQALEYGIVSGPQGFDPANPDGLDDLPEDVAEDLFLEIDDLTDMPPGAVLADDLPEQLEGI